MRLVRQFPKDYVAVRTLGGAGRARRGGYGEAVDSRGCGGMVRP